MTGWKLVRYPPTDGMIEAGIEFRYDSIKHGYAAMIAASPPVGEELVDKVAGYVAEGINAAFGMINHPLRFDANSDIPNSVAVAVLALLNGEG